LGGGSNSSGNNLELLKLRLRRLSPELLTILKDELGKIKVIDEKEKLLSFSC
jgi:hypothetical protein